MAWDDLKFSRVFQALHAPLLRFLSGFTGNRELAEDLAQEALLRLYRRPAPLEDDAARFWLFRTARNLALNALRNRRMRRRLREVIGRALGQQLGSAGDPAIHAETMQRQLALLADLPDQQRAALLLRELEGLTYRQIAQVLDVSESKVKVDIHRARVSLRRRWEPGISARARRERSS
jgi:RNA polymerase sigma-70 factor (ECF subfamily)